MATAYEQQRLVWALRDQPGLLTAGGQGSRRLRTFIDELQAWGARTIAAPRCPFCAASVSLNWTVDGVHWCRACWQRKTRIKPCTRCGRQRPVAARAPEGGVLCSRCHRGHPANHEPCSRCRRVRLIVRRDEDQRLCDGCYRPPTAVCASCGRRRPCYFADTDSPRCEPCSARRRAPQPCSGCGHVRPVNARDAGGKPLCASCSRPTALCHGCGKTKYLGSPLPDGRRLCFYCRSKDPTAARPCVGCGAVAVPPRPLPGLRLRAAATSPSRRAGWADPIRVGRRLRDAEGQPPATGAALAASLRPGRRPHRPCQQVRPGHPRGPRPTPPGTQRPASARRPGRSRRSPAARREPGAPARLDRQDHRPEVDPAEQRLVRTFATWHHLRRLRRQATPVTDEQVHAVRADVKTAVHLLGWLREHGTTLAPAGSRTSTNGRPTRHGGTTTPGAS